MRNARPSRAVWSRTVDNPIPTCFTRFTIRKQREGGYRAMWVPPTQRPTTRTYEASPVLPTRDQVRNHMAYVYAEVIEAKGMDL